MTDRAYTDSQIQTLRNNLESAKERFNTLSQSSSRFGELEPYQLGRVLVPCGIVKADEEGMAINTNMRLLLEDALNILEEYQEVGQIEEDPDPEDDEECERLFSLIRNLDIEVDYDKIDKKIDECCNELKDDLTKIDNDLTDISNKITSVSDNVNNINQKNNSISANISELTANITTVLAKIDQLLTCPCSQDIVNQIQIQIQALSSNIDAQMNALSADIDNINVDGAEVNIDYAPILTEIANVKTHVSSLTSQQTTKLTFFQRGETQTILNLFNRCCADILKNLSNLSFDLSPVLQAIESSKTKILQAFLISEGKIINKITETHQSILTGQTDIKTVISAKIDSYLGKSYNGQIIVHDREGNQLIFPFAGVGLDGITNILLLLAEIFDQLLNQEDDPCNSVALIYSDYYPHKVLVSQLHITFIPVQEKKLGKNIPNRKMHVFNPRENLDWCLDIDPLRPQQGTSGFLRLVWDEKDNSGTVRSWTGGHFANKDNAIDTANKLMALSTLTDSNYRWTEEGTKKNVKAISWKPISAVLVYVENGQVSGLRCFSPPKDGC